MTRRPPPAEDLDRDHVVVSVEGVTCDGCGHLVDGQTDANGTAVIDGDSVHHIDIEGTDQP